MNLILLGPKDGRMLRESVQFLKSSLPRSYLIYVDGATHDFDVDQPERFATLVGDYLKRGEAFLANEDDKWSTAARSVSG